MRSCRSSSHANASKKFKGSVQLDQNLLGIFCAPTCLPINQTPESSRPVLLHYLAAKSRSGPPLPMLEPSEHPSDGSTPIQQVLGAHRIPVLLPSPL